MGWLTGSQHKPVSGKRFNKPVYFEHDFSKKKPRHSVCFPVVNACAKSITFPVQLLQNVESFRELFILAYCKRQAFGRPWTNKWLDCGCMPHALPINWNEKRKDKPWDWTKKTFLCIVHKGWKLRGRPPNRDTVVFYLPAVWMQLYGFQRNNSLSSPLNNMLFALLVELIDTVNILFLFTFLSKKDC